MTWARKAVATALAVVVLVALVYLFRTRRAETAGAGDREAPVVAPSRMLEANGEAVVALDREARQRLGLALVGLSAATAKPDVRLPGEVIEEPERTTVVRSPLSGRLSATPAGSWPTFGEWVRAGREIGQVSDARPLVLSRSGTVTRLGAHPGEIVEAGQVLLEVTDYSEPLARITWSDDGPMPAPATVTLIPSTSAAPAPPGIPARLVGPGSEADPVSRRPTFLYRAQRAWPGSRPGAPLTAAVPATGAALAGVRVPEAAVVQWQGLGWAYVQRSPGHFARVRVPTTSPVAGGWLVRGDLAGGDSVVVRGAQELLSEEFRARVSVGEETGE